MEQKKGLLLVLLTALVSGFSIFANSFAVKGFNPLAFTFLKNAAVAVLLFSLIMLLRQFPSLKTLPKKQWAKLALIGLVGGAIPFLLFFQALSLSTAVTAGFIHKTLFIWATLFAFLFLKEKISRSFIAAAFLLLAGNALLFGITSFGLPEVLILAATVLWAAESTLSKHALKSLPGNTVAFARMFFGSLFILAFLILTGQAAPALSLSPEQAQWVALSSIFLLAYVFTYYNGLRLLPVHKATSMLLIAQPITALLSLAFLGKPITPEQAFGFLLIVAGLFLAVGLGFFLNAARSKGFSVAAQRN